MATFQKRKGKKGTSYRGVASINGRKVYVGTFDKQGAALAAAVEYERKAKAGESAGAPGKILRDVFDWYSKEVSTTKPGVRWEQNRLGFYSRDPIANVRLDALTPQDFADLRDRRLKEVASSTFLRDLALLSNAMKLASTEKNWIATNPISRMRRPKDDYKARSRRLHEGEIDALRIASGYRPNVAPKSATARTIAAFEFACETAMRGGEICAIRKADCHAKHVHIPTSKNGEARDVPLSPRARAILDQVLALGLDPVFGLAVGIKDALFRKMTRRASIDGLTFHDGRREGTSRLAKKVEILELSRITGHRDLSILRDYYRPTVEELAEKIA